VNKWINDCQYHVYIYDKSDENKDKIIDIIQLTADDRLSNNNWKTKKIIGWIPEDKQKVKEYKNIINRKTNWKIFEDPNDPDFKHANTSDIPWCLLLCQKGREGYDVKGIEFGFTIGSSNTHIYVQEMGRCQRTDYEKQLAELLIFTHIDDGKIDDLQTRLNSYMEDDYVDSIQHIDNIDCSCNKTEEEIKLDKEEEEERIEYENKCKERDTKREKMKISKLEKKEIDKANSKKEFTKKIQREKFNNNSRTHQYKLCKQENKGHQIKDKDDYHSKKDTLDYFIDNPERYFEKDWKSWYDFLGISIESYPSKAEFIKKTKKIWLDTNKNIKEFSKKCKENGYPYFDYTGLYGEIPSDLFYNIDKGRRGR